MIRRGRADAYDAVEGWEVDHSFKNRGKKWARMISRAVPAYIVSWLFWGVFVNRQDK